jgi:hypothetical protein
MQQQELGTFEIRNRENGTGIGELELKRLEKLSRRTKIVETKCYVIKYKQGELDATEEWKRQE